MTACNLNPYIFRSGSVSKAWVFAVLAILSFAGRTQTLIRVEEFTLSGSSNIGISPGDLTQLLWRNPDAERRYHVYFSDVVLPPQSSYTFRVTGHCQFEANNHFTLSWDVSRTDRVESTSFSCYYSDLQETRTRLYGSLDSLLGELEIITDPDSTVLLLNGVYRGKSPVRLKNVPLGWHVVSIEFDEADPQIDSFYLSRDTTSFHFYSKGLENIKGAYVKLLTPPLCDLYVGGKRQKPINGFDLYEFNPGVSEILLISHQYGARTVTLDLVVGDTVKISFFNAGEEDE